MILDTSKPGPYSCVDSTLGPLVGLTVTASIDLGARVGSKLSDLQPNNSVGGKYVVASFHTHTPMTYRTGRGRAAGPSLGDSSADSADNVVGIIYDYTESIVPALHPKESNAG